MAVSDHVGVNPDTLLLGVRGTGHGLCVGFAPAGWIVTSQPCGLVGDANRYLRITGAPLRSADKPAGAVVTLNRAKAGELSALRHYHLDGTPHPVRDSEIETTVIRRLGPYLSFSAARLSSLR